jgi:2,3-dihydroxyethylbenzene 1,2-dioxygenase
MLSELGYVGIAVSNGDLWKAYASSVIGMEVVDEGEGDRFYLRTDEWHHRFIIHASGGDDYLYSGWRVAGSAELEALAQQLEAAAIDYRLCDKAEAKERRVLGLLKLTDPSGNCLEVFYGPQIDAHKPFHPGRPMFGRFATNAMGLGHCIIRQDDPVAALKFFRALGFVGDVEYRMSLPDGGLMEAFFLKLNERQHSLGFARGMTTKRFHHVMLEYTDLKDLGLAFDIAQQRQIEVPMSLGMHANDEMLSFYMMNPSGWMFELGWGGRTASRQQEYYSRDVFGHVNMDPRLKE